VKKNWHISYNNKLILAYIQQNCTILIYANHAIFNLYMSGYCVNDDVTDCWILKTGISLIVNFTGRLTGK